MQIKNLENSKDNFPTESFYYKTTKLTICHKTILLYYYFNCFDSKTFYLCKLNLKLLILKFFYALKALDLFYLSFSKIINWIFYYRCSAPCTEECNTMVEQMCSKCNEMKMVPCFIVTERLRSMTPASLKYIYRCDTPCDVTLACGHPCKGTCFQWWVWEGEGFIN